MGLTLNSTGRKIINKYSTNEKYDYTIAIAGNPNVGKSTVFNALTGMHQHTGNWPGKTVENATGICKYKDKTIKLVDIPGTYSIMSNSEEEEIARNYICFGNPDATIIILDATCLQRNLNIVYQIMEITPKVIVCVNLLDEAKKKKIHIDLEQLEKILGVPVVGIVARKKKTLNNLLDKVLMIASNEIITSPNKIEYEEIIEDAINKINEPIKYTKNNYLKRWICLKLLDGDEKIIDEIKKNLKIKLDTQKIKKNLNEIKEDLNSNGIPNENIREKIITTIINRTEEVSNQIVTIQEDTYNDRDRKIDKILTSKKFGIPIMILFLALILWITIVGANYPSKALSNLFDFLKEKIIIFLEYIRLPIWIKSVLIDGIYTTVTWIVAVMLPPMAIFFPIFTLLEDLGYLPRIAFNLDKCFKKACSSGKQALTMCMGLGCNAAGVVGCRIIESPREKLISMITNSFMPCNGRFPFLITIATVFIGGYFTGIFSSIISAIVVLFVILLGIIMTLLISKILSKTILKGIPSSFVLELPPYRKPQIGKVIVRSIFDRTLFVLGRAVAVAIPAGIVIWVFSNINIAGTSILTYVANFLDPFAKLMGLDGYILTAFLLGLPANEIVLPIILMCYMQKGVLVNLEDLNSIGEILRQNGWTLLTGINVMIFTLLHFPCSTTLLSIKKESGKWKWTFLSFGLPTICGILLCILTNFIWNII